MSDSEIDLPRYLTPEQVAKQLNLSVQTVLRMRVAGVLPGVKLSYNVIRFDARELERYLREASHGKN